jgi:hypothetical protein
MHATKDPVPRSVRLREAELRKRGLLNSTDIAARLGIHHTTVWRVLKGGGKPGNAFIAAVLDSFPDDTFEDFFEVTRSAA